ncbi:hypothetical protein LAG90_08915 [Marinilongibacter aquaticus]|uniref:hypothetical protein n=1 Tax=Marinilongibacter aquaticus TaxID=2975157 RepID=UPI0021BD8339|nr:hypothetical protein [Marinilongibacter aquaticus]UBM60754.1 hypothetical protein LAG90_08915 [Marinilongibacter aquaticus]
MKQKLLMGLALCLGLLYAEHARAQSPGGVSTNLRVWLRPENFTPSSWTDASGASNDFSQTNASRQPFLTSEESQYNFNSVVDFGTTGSDARFMALRDGKPYTSDGSNSTMFVTYLNRSNSGYADIIGFGGTTTTASLVNSNAPTFTSLNSNTVLYPYTTAAAVPSISTNVFYLGDVSYTVGTPGIKYGQNGLTATVNNTVAAGNAQNASGAILGSQPEERNGLIGEFIAFESDLNESDKMRVRSYLAIKNGLTLPHNYVASNGSTVFWDTSTNSGYNNNIAGIAKDDNTLQDQRQSNSINAGNQVLISTTGLSNSNSTNATPLTDQQFLVWGDNGQAKTPAVAISGVSGTNFRFGAIWKIQNTNSVGTVRVAWPSGLTNLKLIQSTDATIDAGDVVTDMSGNTQTVNGVTYNYADVVLADGQFFSFAAFVASPGGVLSAAWYKADVSSTLFSDAGTTAVTDGQQVQQWNDVQGKGYNVSQSNSSLRPIFSNSNLQNFNPTVTWDGSNDQMMFDAPTGVNVIDRADGTLYTAGRVQDETGSGMLGFHSSMDYPGLHFFNTGGGVYKLLFFTGGPGYQGLADDAMASNMPFTAGAGWLNGAGATASYAAATVSYNGIRTAYSGNEMQNAVINDSSRDLMIGGDTNYGDFNGELNEFIVFENRLNDDEMDRVESYLAIKYGNTYAKGTRDYKNSSSGVIWDATANAGFGNNIAGIGRDAQSALDQKQSWSSNPGQQLLIGNNGEIQTSNASHGSALSDGQFLIWGDNGLDKAPTVAISGISGVNYRFAAIWKVQNTNNVGTVRVAWPSGLTNLKLIKSSDATIDASDQIIDMGGAVTVVSSEDDYVYADVSIQDGEYLSFAAFVQAPGGVVANLMMWHKADDGTSGAGTKDKWKDVSVNNHELGQTNNAAYQPSLVTDAEFAADDKNYFFNFNPFYYFDGTDDFFYRDNDDYFPSTTSPGSTYGVVFNSAATGWRTPYCWGDDDPDIVRNGDNYYFVRDNGTVINENVGLTSKPAHLAGMAWKGSGAANNGIYLNVNGEILSTTSYNIGNLNTLRNFSVGSEGLDLNGNGNEVFQGGISEVFAYSDDHQNSAGDEKQRINSYLALKYGITLKTDDGTSVPNYLSSSSTVVWDATANAAYNNNIAGLSRDLASALHQRQSISENNGKQVIIGTTGLANTNALNGTDLASDGQFLIWGDNGLAKAPSEYTPSLGNGVNVLFKSIWKVQNTGNVGTVRVAWPATANNLSLIQSSDETFDNSDTFTDMSSNTQVINGVTYNYADVTLSDGQYFTFATLIEHAPGGVFSGLSHWYRADIDATNTGDASDVTSWTDYASGVVSSQISTSPLPKYKTGASDYFNFNPGLNFTATDQKIGNITESTLSSLDFDIISLTKEGMAGSRFFNIGRDNVNLDGLNWDQPGLWANGAITRRTNTGGIGVNGGIGGGNPNLSTTSPSIMYHTFTNTSVSKGLNGAANGTPYVHTAIGEVTGGHVFGANNGAGTSGDDGGIIGNIGEMIVYGSGSITTAERNKVDSYLAIKYGVTLDASVSYITSNDVNIWDKDLNTAYYNNVAGLGRDDLSALHQKQSKSQHANTNDQVVLGLGDIAATNMANANNLSDGEFIVWGDNGNTQAMTNSASTYTTFSINGNADNRHMNRVWKVQNTNVGQSLKISFPVSSVGTTTFSGAGATSYVILYASDENFTTGLSVDTLTVVGSNYEAEHSFPNGASFFTFGGVVGPDLKPSILTSGGNYQANVNDTKDVVVSISNIGTDAATAPVEFYIPIIDETFDIAFDDTFTGTVSSVYNLNADNSIWETHDNMAGTRKYFTLKTGNSIPMGQVAHLKISLKAVGTANSNALLMVYVTGGTGGGEGPETNNSGSYQLNIDL